MLSLRYCLPRMGVMISLTEENTAEPVKIQVSFKMICFSLSITWMTPHCMVMGAGGAEHRSLRQEDNGQGTRLLQGRWDNSLMWRSLRGWESIFVIRENHAEDCRPVGDNSFFVGHARSAAFFCSTLRVSHLCGASPTRCCVYVNRIRGFRRFVRTKKMAAP